MSDLLPCFDTQESAKPIAGGKMPQDRFGLRSLAATDYADIRASLRTGDLLFCSGQNIFANAIKLATGSPWSHVGILFRPVAVDRVLVLEAQMSPGVRPICLSSFLDNYQHSGRPYRGQLVLARHAGIDHVSEERQREFFSWLVDELGRPYSVARTARIAARQSLNLIGLRFPRMRVRQGIICSEIVANAYRRLGVRLPYNPRGFITPGDIAGDEAINLIAKLK